MRARRRFAATALASSAAVVTALILGTGPAAVAAPSPTVPDLTVLIDPHSTPGARIPDDFVGLSVEASTLGTTVLDPSNGNLVGYLRSLGPGVIRFGGDSVDRDLAWQTQVNVAGQAPSWSIVTLHTADLQRLKAFLDATGWKAILGLNLGHYDPDAAADEARTAVSVLGSSLQSLELGNEPNAYVTNGARDVGWGAADYQREVLAYRDAIRRHAGTVDLSGPGSYPPTFLNAWSQVMAGQGTELTQHLYPLNACSTATPTVELLLTHQTLHREQQQIASGLASAQLAGMGLRLGEANNVICSGFYGVSDVFASALWALDLMATAAQSGVVGINVHSGFKICPDQLGRAGKGPYYTPLCAPDQASLDAGLFGAAPEWYGLSLFSTLRGTSFLPVTVSGRSAGSSSAYATVGDDGRIRVLIIDEATRSSDSRHTISVKLDPSWGSGSMITLRGSSPYEASGVRLQGATTAADGSLTPGVPTRVVGHDGVFTTQIPPGSAALLTLSTACSVPDLKGLVITTATSVLSKNGCSVGAISRVKLKRGVHARYVVLRQHSKVGSIYGPGSRVGFTLAPQVLPKKKTKVAAHR